MKVLVLGQGISGKSAINFLRKKNFDVELIDDKFLSENIDLTKSQLDRLLSGLSFIVASPGIKPTTPLLLEAKARKIKIIGELELGFLYERGSVIAVTGTNGKTTTVSLINHILNGSSRPCFLGGNIGTAYTSFVEKSTENSISVLECSSFQLNSALSFKPHIAAILNITEDHLSYHGSMDNYIAAKLKITENQSKSDFLLINSDDQTLRDTEIKTQANIYYFSTNSKVKGCYIKNGNIYFNDNLSEKKLVSLSGIKLLGEHNLSNILCACLAVYLETKNAELLKNISTFQGVEHRIEYVGSASGISFYNDSKATNIDSVLVALKCFKQNVHLILGGSDKGYEFDELFKKMPKCVKTIAVFGETKQKIIAAAKRQKFDKIYVLDNLKQSVNCCFFEASAGEVVLLSPACASFDQFKNFEERGAVFKKIVKEIMISETTLFESQEDKKI